MKFSEFIFKKKLTGENINYLDQSIHSIADELKAIDPDTQNQWKRFQQSIETGTQRETNYSFQRKKILQPALAFGIALIAVLTVGVLLYHRTLTKEYTTQRGQYTSILLPDSNKITLSALSKLKISRPIFKHSWTATLDGEALFQIRTRGIPFVVTTNIGTVKVTGTEFNIRSRDSIMEVGVLNGIVQVSLDKQKQTSTLTVVKNEFVTCTKSHLPQKPEPLSFRQYPGWTNGVLLFNHANLLFVCKEIEYHCNVEIHIERKELLQTTITGALDIKNIENTLASLTEMTGSRYRHENSAYIIY